MKALQQQNDKWVVGYDASEEHVGYVLTLQPFLWWNRLMSFGVVASNMASPLRAMITKIDDMPWRIDMA